MSRCYPFFVWQGDEDSWAGIQPDGGTGFSPLTDLAISSLPLLLASRGRRRRQNLTDDGHVWNAAEHHTSSCTLVSDLAFKTAISKLVRVVSDSRF